jgi:hypothetical protein
MLVPWRSFAAFALAMWLLLQTSGNGSAKSRRPAPRQDSQSAQQAPHADQRGTEQFPFIIKVLPAAQAQEKSNADGAKGPENWNDTWGLSDKIAVIASIVGFLQFLALFATVWVMVRNGRRQLRAYLSIKRAAREGPHRPAPKFNLIFKNCGQTPAYNGTNWGDVQVREFPLTSALIPPEKKIIGRFETPPTSAFTVWDTEEDTISISAEQANEFDNGKIAFYIFGRLDFVDAFHKKRWLQFRFRYSSECVSNGRLINEEIKSN